MVERTGTRRRVCIAYPFFPHYRGPVLEALLRRGRHGYTLVADRRSAEPSIKGWEVPEGVDWVDAPVWRHGRRWRAYVQPGLVRAGLSRRYDTLVIHSGVWWPTTWLCAIAGRLTGKRVVSWGHGWTRREGGVRGLVRRVYYRLYHAHMTYGHFGKVVFMETGWRPEGVHVIYNSLDYAAQKAARETVRPGELEELKRRVMGGVERPVAVCTTRLVPYRRLDQLIEAAAALGGGGRPVDVLLVGDGPEKERLAALAAERGVRCVFYGACYDEGVLSRLIMMSDVMVIPGAAGLAVMHAHAYGTPVVTHDDVEAHGPEFEGLVPGVNGGVFRKGDVEGLADAVAAWTGGGARTEEARRRCWSIVERFWNAEFQRCAIERAIDGEPADDLWWMKPGAEGNPAMKVE
ncbi:MAG: glycosyltransferase family 4 protein [Phycisphaerales bacterium]|nr:glycosyltransferase family 4 protein [Phycisphaerales bacterium]